MKDSQRNVDSYGDKVKYIKANNERFSTHHLVCIHDL